MSSVFKLFLWKNWKYVRFNWLSTSILLLSCLCLLAVYEGATFHKIIPEDVIYEPKTEYSSIQEFNLQDGDVICYAPETPALDKFMAEIRTLFAIPYKDVIPFRNEHDMYEFLDGKKRTRSFGIVFHNFPNSSRNMPSNLLNYTISTTHGKVSTSEVYLNDKRPVRRRDYDDYAASGFFTLQRAIDKNFIEYFGRESPFEIEVVPFPKKAIEEYESERIVHFGIIFLIISYIIFLGTMLIPLVEEKHDGIKEFISLGTRYRFINEITFFLARLLIYIPFIIFAVIIGYNWHTLYPIDLCVISVLFGLHIISLMCYTLLISVCFNSVFYAKVGGTLLYIIHLFLYLMRGSFFVNFIYLSNGSIFLEGIRTFTSYVNKDRTFSFNNLNTTVIPDTFSLMAVLLILTLQTFVYILLYFYFSLVFPGKGGIPERFYFLFQPSFYKKCCGVKNYNPNNWKNTENAIQVRKLSKVYKHGLGRRKIAVNELSMDIKKNRITVLLGHNGAGKTTTLNMIVGLIEKSSGDIQISEASNISEYRHLIGYCPQHSIFMKYLTCAEHLVFFGQLKGLSACEAKMSAANILCKLHMKDKSQEVGKNLSGGMKRKLSLGMAIAGKTKIIILDEPSSGLDPESRRELWDILLNIRKTQAILVTTHYMEEAEVLGDHVAIMSNGKLVCSDSILKLKSKYGSGYVLKLLTEDYFNLNIIKQFVKREIPTAEIKSFVSPTLSISLPYDYKEKYSKLLFEMENSMKDLGIKTISITNTSLEDVFLNCEQTPEDQTDSQILLSPTNEETKIVIPYQAIDIETNEQRSSIKKAQQIFAIFYKKIIYLKREWKYVLFMFIIPFVATILSFRAMSAVNENFITETPLHFSVNHLPKSEIYIKIPPESNYLTNYLEKEIKQLNATPIIIKGNTSVNDLMLDLHEESLIDFHNNILGAVEVTQNEGQQVVRIYYSGNAIHSSVIMLNLVDNILLKSTMGENAKIVTSNMPIKKSLIVSRAKLEHFSHIMPIGWFLYILFYVSLPFKEEKSEFKKLENVPSSIYWIAVTLFDIILHCFICLLVFVLQYLIDTENIYSLNEKGWIMMSFVFYGFAYLPLIYILSSTFKTMSGLSTTLFTIFLVSSIMPLITSSNLKAIEDYEVLIFILSFVPDFSLKHQLHIINENYFITRRNDLMRQGRDENFVNIAYATKPDPLLNHIVFYIYMLFGVVLLEIILIYICDNTNRKESVAHFFRLRNCFNTVSNSQTNSPREDVADEKKRVEEILKDNDQCNYSLIVHDLQKTYGKFPAVCGINFAVKPGECFGLLGLNGAGKTSTFQMITGNKKITKGNAYLNGYNIHSNEHLYKTQFGYCPQVDALNKFMSSYEILKFIALLRGMSLKSASTEASYWIDHLDLIKYRDIPIREYSGGTKRKLNTAIAMIGNPSVIFLDEPTTGVDPKSRRFMWQCIQRAQKDNKTIILTSHSMDECEYLCNRLAIMARGEFQCINFIPYLKNKLGNGYTITFKVKEGAKDTDVNIFKAKVTILFNSNLREQHADIITYSVIEKPVVWSRVFKTLHSLYHDFRNVIEDYSVSETTLEDVFLKCD